MPFNAPIVHFFFFFFHVGLTNSNTKPKDMPHNEKLLIILSANCTFFLTQRRAVTYSTEARCDMQRHKKATM